ncbi:YybH family protein [Nesterenkonia ebinurensis]|uniref:YybH family protein n=1 Tax=Nesterenkonia ebinurensis TaxID=2608252 RepID=UPI00123D80E3|nr:nuclear transport factor 2 family protein [Nesterenkonia ebinurensis]
MTVQEREVLQITEIVEQYRHGFANFDAEVLKVLWDREYDHLIYVAQEAAEPLWDWPSIQSYYDHAVGASDSGMVMEVSNLSVNVFGDLAYAFFTFHFEVELDGEIHRGDGRSTLILRRGDRGWAVIHYHESPPGPVPQAQPHERRR